MLHRTTNKDTAATTPRVVIIVVIALPRLLCFRNPWLGRVGSRDMSSANDVLVYLLVFSMCSQATGPLTGSRLIVVALGSFTHVYSCSAILTGLSRIAAKLLLVASDAYDYGAREGSWRCRGVVGTVRAAKGLVWARSDMLSNTYFISSTVRFVPRVERAAMSSPRRSERSPWWLSGPECGGSER